MPAFLAPVIAWFATASPLAIAAVKVGVGIGLSVLSNLVFGQEQDAGTGLESDVTLEGDKVPQSIAFGRFATAGHITAPFYAADRESGGIPNDTRYQIRSIADAPVTGLTRVWVDDTEFDIATEFTGSFAIGGGGAGTTKADWAGKFWLVFADGAQTVSDSHMVGLFGSHPERPWDANRIGTGVAYVRSVHRYDEEIYSGEPNLLIEGQGAKLYDRRKDSTEGGSGAHRLTDQSTWEFTENPVVMAMNILLGYPLADGTTYGYGVSLSDLPYTEWATAADECDTLVDGNPQYRAGLNIPMATSERGGMVPAEAIRKILATASGEICQAAGTWHIRVGGPELPTVTITDADIVVSNPQELDPFPSVTERFNACRIRHPDPDQRWKNIEAPLRKNSDAVTRDGELRVATVDLEACAYPEQAQRVAQSIIDDDQRQRSHVITLPPEYGILTPLRSIAWTSTRNTYSAKVFEIEGMAIDPDTLAVTVALRERDPDDYDPNITLEPVNAPSTAVISYADFPLPGLAFSAVDIVNADSSSARPGIEITWTADLAGIANVEWQVRLVSNSSVVNEGTIAAGEGRKLVSEGLLASTAYEARARGLSQKTEWSPWAALTTTAAKLGVGDVDADGVWTEIYPQVQAEQQAAIDTANDYTDSLVGPVDPSQPLQNQVSDLASDIAYNPADVDTQDALNTALALLTDLSLQFSDLTAGLSAAGIVTNPETGEIIIQAETRLDQQVSAVQIALDSVEATITQTVTVATMNQAITDAMLDPSTIPVVDDLQLSVTSLQTELDGLAGTITSLGELLEVNGSQVSMTTVQTQLDTINATITNLVEVVDLNALEARVTVAEQAISGLGGASFTTLLQDTYLTADANQELTAATLDQLLQQYENREETIQEQAYLRQEFHAVVTGEREATASALLELGVSVDGAVSLIQLETMARVSEFEAVAVDLTALDTRISDPVTGNEALGTAISGLESTVTINGDEITSLVQDVTQLTAELATVEGEVLANAGAVSVLSTAVSSNDGDIAALAVLQIGLRADVNSNAAEIASVDQTYADETLALSQSLTTLTSTVGGHTAAITQQAATLVDVQGNQSATLSFAVSTSGGTASLVLVSSDDPNGPAYTAVLIDGGLIVDGAVSVRKLLSPPSGVTQVTAGSFSSNFVVLAAVDVAFEPDANGDNPVVMSLFGTAIRAVGSHSNPEVRVQAEVSGSWVTVTDFIFDVHSQSTELGASQGVSLSKATPANDFANATKVRCIAKVSPGQTFNFADLGMLIQQVNR